MTHLITESDSLSNSLTGEAYLNSRREYWRKEAEKDRKNSEPKATVVKATPPSVASSTNGLKGEAYLNSRREYWRKEIANNPSSYKNKTSQPFKKKADESNVLWNLLGFIFGVLFLRLLCTSLHQGVAPY